MDAAHGMSQFWMNTWDAIADSVTILTYLAPLALFDLGVSIFSSILNTVESVLHIANWECLQIAGLIILLS